MSYPGGTPGAAALAAAVAACPAVAALSGGAFGEVATYLPGRRVTGIRLAAGGQPLQVHVVGRYGVPVAEIARQVRDAVSAAGAAGPVDVVVDDLAVPPDDLAVPPVGAAPGLAIPPVTEERTLR